MDAADAQAFFSNMEYHIRSNLETIMSQDDDNVNDDEEPECEVHREDVSKQIARQQELQDRLTELCSLRDLFCQQNETISVLRHQHQFPTQSPMTMTNGSPPVQTVSPELQLETVPSISDFDDEIVTSNGHSRPQHMPMSELSDLQNKTFDETLDEVTGNLERSLRETVNEHSPTSVDKIDSVFEALKRDLSEDELDLSFNLDLEGTDSEIQDAISEIRKEADRMDVFLALDQLQTMQTELDVANKALQEQSLETEELKTLIEEKDQHIASLELERDLYKADASKARDDLATCISRMFEISEKAGQGLDGISPSSTPRNQSAKTEVEGNKHNSVVLETKSSLSSCSLTSTSSQGAVVARTIDPNRKVVQRRAFVSAPSTLDATKPKPTTKRSELRQMRNHTSFDAEQIQSVFRKPTSRRASPYDYDEGESLQHCTPFESPRRHNSMPLSQRFPEPDDEQEHRMCGIFRRRKAFNRQGSKSDIITMKHQLHSLHEMMEVSVSTSEKLRKKISIISRYYESIVRKLQEKNAKLKADKKRTEIDLINQVASVEHERRTAIAMLERRIRYKDQQLARCERLQL